MNYFLAFILALLPLGTRWIVRPGPFEYATLSLYAIDMLIGVLFLYALRRGVIRDGIKKIGLGALLVGLLLAWAVSSQQWAVDHTVALLWSFHLALGIALALVIIGNHAVIARSPPGRTTKQSHIPLYGFLAGALIQSSLALWQFMTQKVVASTWLGVAAQNPETLGVPVIEAYG